MKIICIGDSLTFGFGVDKKQRWVEILKTKFKEVTLLNKGVNGDTSTGILSRFYEDVIEQTPDVCIIMIGTNDFFQGASYNKVFNNLELLIKDCASKKILPIVMTPPLVIKDLAYYKWSSFIDYAEVNANLVKYKNSIINYLDPLKIPYIDLYEVFNQITEKEWEKYFLDGIHPTPLGHEVIAEHLTKMIKLLQC